MVLKSVFADRKSPIAYGYDSDALAIYFSQGPVLNVGAGGFGGGFGGGGRGGPSIPGVGLNLTPNAVPQLLATLEGPAPAATAGGQRGRTAWRRGGRGSRWPWRTRRRGGG